MSGPTVNQPIFDKPEQYEQIRSGLLEGEQVIAVYDAIGIGTGFVAITSLRVVLQDNSFVGKRTALTSIPYRRVTAVSFVSDRSMFGKLASTSQIAVAAGAQTYEVEFRGVDKARHVHDVILWHMVRPDS